MPGSLENPAYPHLSRRGFLASLALTGLGLAAIRPAETFALTDKEKEIRDEIRKALTDIDLTAEPDFFAHMQERLETSIGKYFDVEKDATTSVYEYMPGGLRDVSRIYHAIQVQDFQADDGGNYRYTLNQVGLRFAGDGSLSSPYDFSNLAELDPRISAERYLIQIPEIQEQDWIAGQAGEMIKVASDHNSQTTLMARFDGLVALTREEIYPLLNFPLNDRRFPDTDLLA
jgi:hypothetical protein